MFEGKNIMTLDIECDGLDVNTAKLKFVGIKKINQPFDWYQFPRDKKDIISVIKEAKVINGFNLKSFDIPIIQNNLQDDHLFDYKVIVDLYEISAPKVSANFGKNNKNRLAQMGYKLKSFTLKNIIELLKLDTEGTKGDIDYKIFQKNEWTSEELIEIKKYLNIE